MDKIVVKEKLISQLPVLRERFHVKTLGFFGSFARGEETGQSDLDILVEFDKPVGFFEFIRLEKFLSDILNYRVDLVAKDAIKPAIKEQILKETIYV